MLIVFDRLFGTYVPERADLRCRYGPLQPMTGYNFLRVEFNEWIAMGRDLARARSLRAVLGHLFMPPGWAPNGEGSTTAALRPRPSRQHTPQLPGTTPPDGVTTG